MTKQPSLHHPKAVTACWGVQRLHFPALFPLAAQAVIFIASVPKSTQVAGAFQSFGFDCFKNLVVASVRAPHPITPGGGAQGTCGTGRGGFPRSEPQGLLYRSAPHIGVVGVTVL